MAFRFVLNRKGVRELLRSNGMMAAVEKPARKIANAAGPGHEVETFRGRNRVRATVRTTTSDAAIAEQAHKNLTNAIKAGR